MSTAGGGGATERLARIEEKLDALNRSIAEQMACIRHHDDRLSALERVSAARSEQINAIVDDVSELERKSERWSIINSVGAAIAAVLGGMGLFPK